MTRQYFYPRSPCGERPRYLKRDFAQSISIHALLAESDNNVLPAYAACGISIHALLAESDPSIVVTIPPCSDFYPRSPCGERLKDTTARQQIADISIHALLAESDKADSVSKWTAT